MGLSKPASAALGGAILILWSALNEWLFSRWLGTSYVGWYVANGSLIGLISSVVALSWGDVNRHVGLISAHPFDYIGSYFQLAGLPVYEIGTHLRSDPATLGRRSGFDLLVTGVIASIMTAAILGWILFVIPLQYFLYLLCGAPGRVFALSQRRVAAQLRDGRLEIREVGRGEKLHDDWWEASIASKPVAFTGLMAALVLAVVKLLA